MQPIRQLEWRIIGPQDIFLCAWPNYSFFCDIISRVVLRFAAHAWMSFTSRPGGDQSRGRSAGQGSSQDSESPGGPRAGLRVDTSRFSPEFAAQQLRPTPWVSGARARSAPNTERKRVGRPPPRPPSPMRSNGRDATSAAAAFARARWGGPSSGRLPFAAAGGSGITGIQVNFVHDSEYLHRSQLLPRRDLAISWTLTNAGASAWPHGLCFSYVEGNLPYSLSDVQLAPLGPGEKAWLSAGIRSPAQPGSYYLVFGLTMEGKTVARARRIQFTVREEPVAQQRGVYTWPRPGRGMTRAQPLPHTPGPALQRRSPGRQRGVESISSTGTGYHGVGYITGAVGYTSQVARHHTADAAWAKARQATASAGHSGAGGPRNRHAGGSPPGGTGSKRVAVGAHFVKDMTVMDGQVVTPGQVVVKTWLIKNTGKVAWPAGTRLVCIGGNWPVGDTSVLVDSVLPGSQAPISVTLHAPRKEGRQSARFQLQLAGGRRFGHRYWVNVHVAPFPKAEKLLELGRQLLVDPQAVGCLQGELPYLLESLSLGLPLLRTAEELIRRRPKLKSCAFVLYVWRFLPAIDRYFRAELGTATRVYATWCAREMERMDGKHKDSVSATPQKPMPHRSANGRVPTPHTPASEDGKSSQNASDYSSLEVGSADSPVVTQRTPLPLSLPQIREDKASGGPASVSPNAAQLARTRRAQERKARSVPTSLGNWSQPTGDARAMSQSPGDQRAARTPKGSRAQGSTSLSKHRKAGTPPPYPHHSKSYSGVRRTRPSPRRLGGRFFDAPNLASSRPSPMGRFAIRAPPPTPNASPLSASFSASQQHQAGAPRGAANASVFTFNFGQSLPRAAGRSAPGHSTNPSSSSASSTASTAVATTAPTLTGVTSAPKPSGQGNGTAAPYPLWASSGVWSPLRHPALSVASLRAGSSAGGPSLGRMSSSRTTVTADSTPTHSASVSVSSILAASLSGMESAGGCRRAPGGQPASASDTDAKRKPSTLARSQ